MYALQAITTKYLAPTNSRGARVKATAAAGSITIPWDHALDPCANHYAAALALTDRMEWKDGEFHRPHAFGCLPDGNGYVLAFVTV
jgi:hypothetical protein